jgi:hypothetical protein
MQLHGKRVILNLYQFILHKHIAYFGKDAQILGTKSPLRLSFVRWYSLVLSMELDFCRHYGVVNYEIASTF